MGKYFLEMNSVCKGIFFFLEMTANSSNMKKQQDPITDY